MSKGKKPKKAKITGTPKTELRKEARGHGKRFSAEDWLALDADDRLLIIGCAIGRVKPKDCRKLWRRLGKEKKKDKKDGGDK